MPRNERADFSRVDWRRKDVGRIAVTVNASSAEELHEYHLLLTKLYTQDRALLLAVRDRDVSLIDVMRVYRREGLFGLVGLAEEARLGQNLWLVLGEAAARLGRSKRTRGRYAAVATKLRVVGGLRSGATVRALGRIDWAALRTRWTVWRLVDGVGQHVPASAADWNYLGRFLSSMLTSLLGGKSTGRAHPFRRRVIDSFPFEREYEREVTLTMEQFAGVVTELPEYLRPTIVTLAVTGIRLGEYLSMTEAALEPAVPAIRVRGKTGPRALPVDPALWPWVVAAVPSPVISPSTIRKHFYLAAARAGLPDLRVHDLRHVAAAAAMWGSGNIAAVRDYLGHANAKTTMRYLRGSSRQDASDALAQQFSPVLAKIQGGKS